MTVSIASIPFTTPLRTYVLLHTYIKSLLNGVQGSHAATELSVKFEPGTLGFRMYQQWARKDKTILFLDGGVSLHMHALLAQLQSLGEETSFPWASFNEDEATLEGMLTSIAFILPESIAKASAEDWEATKFNKAGPIHDDLITLGMTEKNEQTLFAVLEWARSRPLAS